MGSQAAGDLVALRQQLKVWEKTFAAQNGGRKAGREDIKKDAIIAAKYREYDRLRRPAAAVQRSSPKKVAIARDVDRPAPASPSTSRHAQLAATPQKRRIGSPEATLLSPTGEMSPTPQALRQRLGPTPQKDGQILSLFDNLYSCTPSKSHSRDALGSIDANVAATPSKVNAFSIQGSLDAENARLSRTPQSSGKRYMLDTFATPIKRKRDEVACTPTSGRGVASTPAFLRRSTTDFLSTLDPTAEDEDAEDNGKRAPPFKKRGLVRSLSSIIRNLRDQVEETLDEDLELMREMEAEAEGEVYVRPQTKSNKKVPEILVEDSQVDMPLGPDRGNESDEDEPDKNDGLDHEGKPRKVWKKKGLKRQTKRVIMRPVLHKTLKPDVQPEVNEDEEEAVLETQLQNQYVDDQDENEDPAHIPDEESDYSDVEAGAKKRPAKVDPTQKPLARAPTQKEGKGSEAVGVIKKAARKVSATAHANFKKLKIKNKNSKANGRGRFGRR